MATVFKTFLNDDVVTSRTLLHEAIPITGSLVVSLPEGSYTDPSSPASNVKTYPHGMFQSVYDYPYASSSANHIFDVTVGLHTDSNNYAANSDPWAAKKKNIYMQMAQVLVGHDSTGKIMKFDQDGDFAAGGVKYNDVLFLNIARLISKDEIRKGSFELKLGGGQPIIAQDDGAGANTRAATKYDQFAGGSSLPEIYVKVSDEGAETDYRVNSPAGEYGILKLTGMRYYEHGVGIQATELTEEQILLKYSSSGNAGGSEVNPDAIRVGLIYYQAGIVVLDRSLFAIGAQAQDDGGVGINFTEFPIIDPTTGVLPYDMALPEMLDAVVPVIGDNFYDNEGAYYTANAGRAGLHWSVDDRAMIDWASLGPNAYVAGTDAGMNAALTGPVDWTAPAAGDNAAFGDVDQALIGGSIDQICTGLRGRIIDLSFNNTTELNSTIYFCRVNHNDFNYSSNPTYLGSSDDENDNSKIRVKKSSLDAPVSYVTTIGLYSADNELLAVAKLSEPLRKDPTNEMTLRVRLDY